jgi:hypothetical protein
MIGAQDGVATRAGRRREEGTMKTGIIITTVDAAACATALQFAVFNRMEHDEVNVYFVGAGTEYFAPQDPECRVTVLSADFVRAGGTVYTAENREMLKHRFTRDFFPLISARQIEIICQDEAFQHIITNNVHIRKFCGAAASGCRTGGYKALAGR